MMITLEKLRELLHYEPSTGAWTWRASRGHGFTGKAAGSFDRKRYRVICVCGCTYKAHRLAWLYMTGAWPKHDIDHINGIKVDNRFCNLRGVTRAQGLANAGLRADNRAGFKGVSWIKAHQKYKASICVNRKLIHLGYFDNPVEAATWYHAFAQLAYGQYARAV